MKLHKMNQVDVYPNMTVVELLESMKDGGFTCSKVARASDLLLEMIKDQSCTVFLGIAGALIPGGMRKILFKMKKYIKIGASSECMPVEFIFNIAVYIHVKEISFSRRIVLLRRDCKK